MPNYFVFVVDLLGPDVEGRQVVGLECGHVRVIPRGYPAFQLWEESPCPQGCFVDARGRLYPGQMQKGGEN